MLEVGGVAMASSGNSREVLEAAGCKFSPAKGVISLAPPRQRQRAQKLTGGQRLFLAGLSGVRGADRSVGTKQGSIALCQGPKYTACEAKYKQTKKLPCQ